MRPVVRFVLVEENDHDAQLIQETFAAYWPDAPLAVFSDSNRALDALRLEETSPGPKWPSVILFGVDASQTGGLHFLHELRQDPLLKRRTVFVLSNSAQTEDLLAAYDWQVAGYVLKPRIAAHRNYLVDLLQRYTRVVEFPIG